MRPGNFPPYSESQVIVSTFGWPGAGVSKRSVRLVYSTHPCANTGRATSSTNSGSIIERRGINFSFREGGRILPEDRCPAQFIVHEKDLLRDSGGSDGGDIRSRPPQLCPALRPVEVGHDHRSGSPSPALLLAMVPRNSSGE